MKICRKLLVVFLLSLFVAPIIAQAETENNVQFSVSPIFPDNQSDKDQGYFDLKMTPDQKQTIEVQVFNTSGEKAKFNISVNQAYTNASGFIEYNKHDVKKDSSLKYDIDDMVKYDKTIEIEGNASAKVPIEITMPNETFDGEIMAAIQVKKDTGESKEGITNAYGYIIGLRLTETDTEIKRELNLLDVKPAISFNKTSVVATLQNPTMNAYGHLKYQVKVTNLDTKEVEKEETYDSGMEMAPNSTYDFAIDWNNKELVPGKYNLNLIVSDAKSNEWKFNKDFQVTKTEAKDINNLTLDVPKNNDNIWLFILIGVVIFLILIILFILFFKRKKKKEEEKRKKNKLKNKNKSKSGSKKKSKKKNRTKRD